MPEGRVAGAENEAIGIDAIENCGCNAGAEREAEQRDGRAGCEALKKLE